MEYATDFNFVFATDDGAVVFVLAFNYGAIFAIVCAVLGFKAGGLVYKALKGEWQCRKQAKGWC